VSAAGQSRHIRVIGVGDNTVDRYLHLGMMFPGGNAVNVAVFARRWGHAAAYIGCVADDERGRLLLDSLAEEGLDIARMRVLPGITSYSDVTLVDGDRVFVGFLRGVSAELELTDDDLAFIAGHDLVHTSVYSEIDAQLPRLRAAARQLSYDFSDEWDLAMLERVFPHIDIALLSTAALSHPEVIELLNDPRFAGPRMIVATRGSAPALVRDNGVIHEQGIVETELVDTLGAGDAFAARLLIERTLGTPVDQALALAAQSAAEACTDLGGWGHGAPFTL
jgi:fructoselysine 6-kinase